MRPNVPWYALRRGDSSAGASRPPKKPLATSSTASGLALVLWKYRMRCRSWRFERPQGEAVEHHRETRPRHRGTREHRREQPSRHGIEYTSGDRNQQHVVAKRPDQVPANRPHRAGAPRISVTSDASI